LSAAHDSRQLALKAYILAMCIFICIVYTGNAGVVWQISTPAFNFKLIDQL